jgi:hypothetical protein
MSIHKYVFNTLQNMILNTLQNMVLNTLQNILLMSRMNSFYNIQVAVAAPSRNARWGSSSESSGGAAGLTAAT